jgi:hypothetical protein
VASTSITELRPTTAAVALDLSGQGDLGVITAEEVATAAGRVGRGPVDGRVHRGALADIYFELRRMKGLQ